MSGTASKRILILGAQDAGIRKVLEDLTGSAPIPHEDGSIAGLSHEWHIKNAYYSANVPIWIDELLDVDNWRDEFLKAEAKEVVDAIGAWMFCFRHEASTAVPSSAVGAMQAIEQVISEHVEDSFEVLKLAVAVSNDTPSERKGSPLILEENSDACLEHGFEYIEHAAHGKNEYGEKLGMDRLKEALETNEWTLADNEDALSLSPGIDLDNVDQDGGLDRDEAEWTAELFEVKAALHSEESSAATEEAHEAASESDTQINDIDQIMGKLLAIREQGTDLPLEQRKRMAAEAVKEIMRQNPTL